MKDFKMRKEPNDNSIWIVTGLKECGKEWILVFNGNEEPSRDRINYVYATRYPSEWRYSPQVHIESVTRNIVNTSVGPILNSGYNAEGLKVFCQ